MQFFCGTSRFISSAVSQKLVRLIETNAEEMSRSYAREIRTMIETPSYRTFDEREVHDRGHRVFSQFGRWISNEISEKEMENYWTALGKQRRIEGFSMSEIMIAICLIRRDVWQKIRNEGLLDTAEDLYEAMELYGRIVNFFERAQYYTVRGFEGKT
ncbi:MAG: hypothetical protein NTW38_11145 [Candidatus Aminicenantes bacterium]|nr:hypothetical protein [Candidatus Aminicenantes bacterium]